MCTTLEYINLEENNPAHKNEIAQIHIIFQN